jgi:hypothetical protein
MASVFVLFLSVYGIGCGLTLTLAYFPDMKKTLLVDVICYFFILLFVYTGVAKLMEMHMFREQIISSPLLGSFAVVIVWALPIGEFLLAAGLLWGRFRRVALYATLGLMSLFTIYVIALLFIDNHLSCSCGGIIEELSPKAHVLFNSACVLLALTAIVALRRGELSQKFWWMTSGSTLCLFLLVGWTLFTAFSAPAAMKTGMEGRLLPSLNLLLMDSVTHFNTEDIPTGQPFIIIGFSPWCIHCQRETDDIMRHITMFRHIPIYYVTPLPYGPTKAFYKGYKMQEHANIVMGLDAKNNFMTYFKANGIPFTAIFDAQKRLKKVISGEAVATDLAKWTME